MKAIACIDGSNGLGYKGDLLFHLKKDMKRFRELTTGGIAIMGYNTYLSLPNGPLPNRTNIVMTRSHSIENDGVVVVRSREELLEYIKKAPADIEAWVIGGAAIYRELMGDCDEVYLTRVFETKKSDCFFPPLGDEWVLSESKKEEENGIGFSFEKYSKVFG